MLLFFTFECHAASGIMSDFMMITSNKAVDLKSLLILSQIE